MFFSPLEQFQIIPVFMFHYPKRIVDYTSLYATGKVIPFEDFLRSIDADFFYHFFMFTNYILYLLCTMFLIYVVLRLPTRGKNYFMPTNWQFMIEQAYLLTIGIVKEQAGLRGLRYTPLLFYVLVFILASNVIGLTPYAFTTTSLFIQDFFIASWFFLTVTLIGIKNLGFSFLRVFFPRGVPLWLLPLIFVIEVLSYIARPISLSVRLFANMLAGHSLLHILSSFTIILYHNIFIVSGFVLVAVIAVTLLEIGIALIQAYVFTVLLSIYFNSSLYKH